MAIQKEKIDPQSQKGNQKGDKPGTIDGPTREQVLAEGEKDSGPMDVPLTHEQKVILSQFTDYTKGLTIKDICEPENEVDLPFNMVYTVLQELTFLKLLRIGKAGDTAKWFITYAGIGGGNADAPWP